ncbi:Aquaporin-4 [Tulasnella sp. JGI-2019a]|nr:Aquaporin-4 [Tulasnella sp. JGI-2019a]
MPRSFFRNPDGSLLQSVKQDMQAAVLEFCGTFIFLLLGLGGIQAAAVSNEAALSATSATDSGGGVSVNRVASIDQLMFISAAMGLSLLIAVWLFYRVTGGVFNPAVSTALLLVGAIGPVRWALYCAAQLIGGIAAAAVLQALLPGPLASNTTPGGKTNNAQAVFIEMFITAALVLAVLMLAAEKHRSTPFAPIGIGLTLFACHLFAVIFTGASMNTARSFGPAVVSGFPKAHWVYWVGPFLGSLLATFFYSILKQIKYWNINPGQDLPDGQSPPGPIETIRSVTLQSKSNLATTPEIVVSANTGRVVSVGNMSEGSLQEKHAPSGHAINGLNAV